MAREALRTTIIAIAIVAFLGMVYAGVNLMDTWQEYKAGDEAYDSLRLQARGQAPAAAPNRADANGGPAPQAERLVDIPDIGLDSSRLGGDMTAWLYSPDTVIDYPVMDAKDYYYYLGHLPDGTANKNGSLFTDYNCAPDFTDRLSIIYGHNMKSGRMFGSLAGYKKQAYYDEHPYMYLYTAKGNYRVDLVYGFVIDAPYWVEQGFILQENAAALLEYAGRESTFVSGVGPQPDDRLIVLSTCSYEFTGARYAVLGVLRPEYAGKA